MIESATSAERIMEIASLDKFLQEGIKSDGTSRSWVGGVEYSAKEDQTKEKDAEEEKKRGSVKGEKHGEIGRDRKEEETQERKEGPSLEEISKLRGTAQQNTMEAIRVAEERS
ncbi:hypothetical protein DH2020_004920 [Rehmannia glutinosa]|uniref:Uncharacterized protein n=1 Tax=Rehmannia glutinosa TaxID=99300 RepID=A0ABR0XQU6_REHGL